MTLGLLVFEAIGSVGFVVGLVGAVLCAFAVNNQLRRPLFGAMMSRSRYISPEQQAEFEEKSAASIKRLLRWGVPMLLSGAAVLGLAYGADVLFR